MAGTATSYRIWQSPEGLLIQAGGASIEVSVADAIAIATEITTRLAPAPRRRQRRVKWTPELSAECVRLYLDEKQGFKIIGESLGISLFAARSWVLRAGVMLRPAPRFLQNNLIRAHAAIAAKRAATKAPLPAPSTP